VQAVVHSEAVYLNFKRYNYTNVNEALRDPGLWLAACNERDRQSPTNPNTRLALSSSGFPGALVATAAVNIALKLSLNQTSQGANRLLELV
jgi:hypothetical protein